MSCVKDLLEHHPQHVYQFRADDHGAQINGQPSFATLASSWESAPTPRPWNSIDLRHFPSVRSGRGVSIYTVFTAQCTCSECNENDPVKLVCEPYRFGSMKGQRPQVRELVLDGNNTSFQTHARLITLQQQRFSCTNSTTISRTAPLSLALEANQKHTSSGVPTQHCGTRWHTIRTSFWNKSNLKNQSRPVLFVVADSARDAGRQTRSICVRKVPSSRGQTNSVRSQLHDPDSLSHTLNSQSSMTFSRHTGLSEAMSSTRRTKTLAFPSCSRIRSYVII